MCFLTVWGLHKVYLWCLDLIIDIQFEGQKDGVPLKKGNEIQDVESHAT